MFARLGKCSWLQQQVLESWRINNPQWNIELIDIFNLKNYVDDIDYIYDKSKIISLQAKSDIIRLSLLKNYGGVWSGSTLLCMQPLITGFMKQLNQVNMDVSWAWGWNEIRSRPC